MAVQSVASANFDGDSFQDIVYLKQDGQILIRDANDTTLRKINLGIPQNETSFGGNNPFPSGHFGKADPKQGSSHPLARDPVRAALEISDPSHQSPPKNNNGNGKGPKKGAKKGKKNGNGKSPHSGQQNSQNNGMNSGSSATTVLTVGKFNGTQTAIYFTGEDHEKIYRARPGDSVTVIAVPHNGVDAVVGFGDMNSDNQNELVFLDRSQRPRYMEKKDVGYSKPFDRLELGQGTSIGSEKGLGVGAPVDFNGDGQVGLPVVDEENNLKILYADQAPRLLAKDFGSGCDCASKAPLTATDVDGDGLQELVALAKNTNKVVYVDDQGATVKEFHSSKGRVTADEARGVGSSFGIEFQQAFQDRDTSTIGQPSQERIALQLTQNSSLKRIKQSGSPVENLIPGPVEVMATNSAIINSKKVIPFLENKTRLGLFYPDNNQVQYMTLSYAHAADIDQTLIAGGTWGDRDLILYAGQDNETIYGVDQGTVVSLAQPQNGVSAISGIGDVDGDGQGELVFADASSQNRLRYVNLQSSGNGSSQVFPVLQQDPTATPGDSDALGVPGDYNKDGMASVPIVDANNSVALVSQTDPVQYFGVNQWTGCNCAEQASVTTTNLDDDASLEFVFIQKTDHSANYFENRGESPTPLLNDQAETVSVDTSTIGAISAAAAGSDSGPSLHQPDRIKEGFMYTQSDSLFEIEYDGGTTSNLPLDGVDALSSTTVDTETSGFPVFDLFFSQNTSTGGFYNRDTRESDTFSPPPVEFDTSATLYAAGEIGDSPAVAYPSKSNDRIFLFIEGIGGTMVDPDNGVSSLAGFGNVDGDLVEEVVFVDTSANHVLRHFELSQTGTSQSFSSLNISGLNPGGPNAVGSPGDYAGDSIAEVPIVGPNNGAALVNKDGSAYMGSDRTSSCNCAETAPVTVTDVDLDTPPEFVYQDQSSGAVKYFDDGGATQATLRDTFSNTVTVSEQRGIASVTKTYEEAFAQPDTTPSDTSIQRGEPINTLVLYARGLLTGPGMSLTKSFEMKSIASERFSGYGSGIYTFDLTDLAPSGVEAMGSGFTDYDADSIADVPYLKDSQTLKFADRTDTDFERSGFYDLTGAEAATNNTLMAVGTFEYLPEGATIEEQLYFDSNGDSDTVQVYKNDGDTAIIDLEEGQDSGTLSRAMLQKNDSVYYASKDGEAIYRIGSPDDDTYSDTPELVAEPANGVSALSGFGDVNADSYMELVFTDTDHILRYMEKREVGTSKSFPQFNHGTIGPVGVNNGIGLGVPMLSSQKGIGVPIVTQDNGLALVFADTEPMYLIDGETTSCNCVAKAPLSARTQPFLGGLAFLGKDDHAIRTLGAFGDGDTPVQVLTNSASDTIVGDPELGLVTMFISWEDSSNSFLPCIIERSGAPERVLDVLRASRDAVLDSSIGRSLTKWYYEWFGAVSF